MKYYVVTEEWNYPTESGQNVSDIPYDTRDEALAKCAKLAEGELANFESYVGMDALDPANCADGGVVTGVLITTKMGLDPYYYYARIIEVTPLLEEDRSKVCKVKTIATSAM